MGAQHSPTAPDRTIVGASIEMKIRSLTLKNFRGFEDATLDLDRPLTVLFGVNGSGKSSVLAACTVALSNVMRDLSQDEDERIWTHSTDENDIRHGATELSVTATLSNGDVVAEVVATHYPGKKKSTLPATKAAKFSRRDIPLPSVFYGASREVATAADAFSLHENDINRPANFPFSSIHDAMAAGQLKFRSLFLWFKAREDVENELKVAQQNLSLEDPQLAAVRRAVAGMLPGFSGLRIQRDPLHMMIRKGDTTLVIDQLSDGEKLLLALTADLARRLAMAYPNHDDPLQGETIVLIDEIELHLHPAWQRRVLGALRSTFPSCQFIVTTHSPQVLSEVPNDAVVLVKDFQFFRPAAPTEGRDSNSILWEVLDVPAHPAHTVNELDAINALLDEGKSEEARERIDHLAQVLTERDTEIGRLRSLLDVTERLDASDPKGT
jgi:predicted ATP-binding protein involved in virulence